MNPYHRATFVDKERWQARATCRPGSGIDPDAFFVSNEEYKLRQPRLTPDEEITMRYCAMCTVSGNCLRQAMENKSLVGIWGGTTTRMRQALRRPGFRVSCVRCGKNDHIVKDTYQICRSCGLTWLLEK